MESVHTPPCALYKKCGGCQLQHLPYAEQLRRKQGRAIALLGKFGHVAEILGMEKAAAVRLMRGEDFPAAYIEAGDVYVVDQANLAKWVAAHARRVEGVNDTLFDVI